MEDAVGNIRTELREHADPARAEHSSNWFKNRPGEIPDDLFLGTKVPEQRKIAQKYFRVTSIHETEKLLASKWHEERLTALFILVYKYEKSEGSRQQVFDAYISNLKYINNWDLVDSSAPHIIGEHLRDNPYKRKVFNKMAESDSVWERRVAVLAAGRLLNYSQPEETLLLAKKLLNDKDDYIHKATGWMLREMSKRVSQQKLLRFLDEHAPKMPRTMLRYAIEHLDYSTRKHYLGLE